MSLAPSSQIRRNGDVIAAGVAQETVLLDPTDWTYIHFNETAAKIWETLDEPRSVADVVDALMRDYDVDRPTCEAEVAKFVREMSGRGLIIVEPAP